MSSAFGLDLALRASNLEEQRGLVEDLRARGAEVDAAEALSPLDTWKLDKLARLLAAQRMDDTVLDPAVLARLEEDLRSVLTAHRRLQLAPDRLDAPAQGLLARTHAGWLPAYRAALASFDPGQQSDPGQQEAPGGQEDPGQQEAPGGQEDPGQQEVPGGREDRWWRDPDIYDGRFARACEPFLVQVRGTLAQARGAANRRAGRELFTPAFAESFERHLLDRFELTLAWAIEADTNVYCAKLGIDPALSSADDYRSYLDDTFGDSAAYHRFFCRFPMLGRWLATLSRLACDNACLLFDRLGADVDEVASCLFGQEVTALGRLEIGLGDHHAGGQSVTRIEVDLADGQPGTVLYKPHPLQAEAGMQALLTALGKAGVIDYGAYRVLARPGYGYAEFIPGGRNDTTSVDQAAAVYRELGGYLALFHVLGGSDLHFENIRIADGHAFVCDCETVLGVRPSGQPQAWGTVLDSVYKTGLLEWPRASPGAPGAGEMRLSGYGGGESYVLPMPVPRINDRRRSLAVGVTHRTGVRVEADAANRVFLHGRLMLPEDFRDAIVDGFNRVHTWFEDHRADAAEIVRGAFGEAPVRFVNWATQVYAQMLVTLRHPKSLMEPLEVDLVLNKLLKHARAWDGAGTLGPREIASLRQLDVPVFTATASEASLVHDYGATPVLALDGAPLDDALERIRRLTPANRTHQVRYLSASLASSEVHSPAFVASAVDYACKVGRRLVDLQRDPAAPAPWLSYQLTPTGPGDADISSDLYNGSAGVALFLAYLDAVAPHEEFRRAAERALAHAMANPPNHRIGVFNGISGLVYVLTHLSQLWNQPELLKKAILLARHADSMIREDRDFDVLSGVAGVIPVMMGLARLAPGVGLGSAHRCADRLLAHAERGERGWSWPLPRPEDGVANFTGFAHGAAGIGWALISLGQASARPDCVEAGRQAFAYEAQHYDAEQQDWYDLRTSIIARARGRRHFANVWCNGSAGIGLSRIACWAMLGKQDDALLRDASLALSATLRTFHQVGNDSLCHGRCGNAELFLRFALLNDAPAFQLEANVQAQVQWNDLDQHGRLAPGDPAQELYPGLMLGLSGLGMHFLRLAHPDRIPSPLLLDPVPSPVADPESALAGGLGVGR